MFERVDHIAIAVWNIDESLSYYREELGFPLVRDEYVPGVGVRLAYLDAGNTFIQLVQPTTSSAIREFLHKRGEGLHHVCLATERIADALSHLKGEAQTQIFPGGRGRLCSFLLHHPNEVLIELTENKPYTQGQP